MTQEEKAKRYDDALERAKLSRLQLLNIGEEATEIEYIFPELKESEDERIRKELLESFKYQQRESRTDKEWLNGIKLSEVVTWLEKQGNTNETIDRDEFAQGVLRGAAINLITWIDYNAAEGNTCLSNVQCKEIENALVRGDWNKIYAYMKKKLERQEEQKHIFDFNANNWYVSKVDGKIHNIYNSEVEPKFHEDGYIK